MWKGCKRTVFGWPELGFRWSLAFSDPLPTNFIFVSVPVRLLTCYGPLPVSFNGFEAAVSAACGRVANALFLACLSSDLGGVWPFRIRGQRASFLSLCRLGCLPATVLYLCLNGFEAAVSAACGRVANALFLACLSSDLGGVGPCRIRCQRASFLSLCRLGCLPATVLYLCLLTVSKLQFRQRVDGLRTHCFWLA